MDPEGAASGPRSPQAAVASEAAALGEGTVTAAADHPVAPRSPPVRAFRAVAASKASAGVGGSTAGVSIPPSEEPSARGTRAGSSGGLEWPTSRAALAALAAIGLAALVLFAEVYISLRSHLSVPFASTLHCAARAPSKPKYGPWQRDFNASSALPAWWGWGHAPSLPRELLQRGVQYRGGDGLLRLATKLARGQPISVGIVGGSVSVGHGARSNRESWSGLMFDAIAARFPNPRHRYLNGAVGACGSSYFEACVDWHVPMDADVVFLEFAVNDGVPRSGDLFPLPEVKTLERLVRKLLAFKSSPAVVVFNFFSWEPDNLFGAFYSTIGDQYCTVAQFYGQSCLSFRDAVYSYTDAVAAPASPNARVSAMPKFRLPGSAPVDILDDLHHPNPLGHRMMADLALALIEVGLRDVAAGVAPSPAPRAADLPRPMLAGNYVQLTQQCVFNEALGGIVSRNDGNWAYVVEGSKDNPKPGYVTTKAGAVLELTIDTLVSRDRAGSQAHIVFGVLRSYEHMGYALFECISQCTCSPTEINGHQAAKISNRAMFNVIVTQAKGCVLRVTVLDKVRGVLTRLPAPNVNFTFFLRLLLLPCMAPLQESCWTKVKGAFATFGAPKIWHLILFVAPALIRASFLLSGWIRGVFCADPFFLRRSPPDRLKGAQV